MATATLRSSEAKKFNGKKVEVFNVTGHLIVGSLLGVFVAHSPLEFGLILFGSLLPDIDHPKSTLGKWNILNRTGLFTHRGKCHTIIGSVGLSLPFFLLGGYLYPLIVFGGAVGHLCADKLASWLPGHRPFKLKVW